MNEPRSVQPPADSAANPVRWFYIRDRQKVGPVSLEQLQQLCREGQLQRSDMILAEGQPRWQSAAVVPGLFVEEKVSLGDNPFQSVRVSAMLSEDGMSADPLRLDSFHEADSPLSSAINPAVTYHSDPEKSRDSPATAASALPSIPGYAIEGVLGRGGMGVVYKARHLALKRTVALKMVLAGRHAGPQELARFRIEAEAVARLQHPNIVQVHEVGAADGHPYCALEFVEGGNLANRIKGKPLSVGEAVRLVETLARAAQLAHSRNVVHRDLKPANILLGADGTPKITDFGLARQLDSDSGATQTGAVMGTPAYMAPEQASGRTHEAGPAADVYALGAILYECLTGRPPFGGQTLVETLDQVRTQEPVPPSRRQAGVTLDVETICLKCLRKEPEQRYTSAAALAEDLARYQRGEPIAARPVGRRERAVKWVKRNPVATGAAAAVVLALALGTTVSYRKYLDAEEQRGIAQKQQKEAQAEADKARKARDFLVSIFRVAETDVLGGNITARQILADAEKRLPNEFAAQPNLHDKAAVKLQQAAGNDWAFYNGGNRWTYGVYMYKAAKQHGMKFRLSWHWNACAGDPYYALDCREDDYCWCNAGPAGQLVPAVDFERLREGLGDYRRLLTLDRLAKAKAGTPAAQAARQLLADILGSFQLGDRQLKGESSFAQLRARLDTAIEQLR